MLRDRTWALSYKTDDGSLAERFYTPVLSESDRYDRGIGYFSAGSLSQNMRGIEGLIHNGGKMRLLVGCTLKPDEIEAVQKGEDLKRRVEKNLCGVRLDPLDPYTADSLELLSWMIAMGHMEIKIAVTLNEKGDPGGDPIYHKKIGIAEDSVGNKIAWNGSDNMTPYGLSLNSEIVMAYTSWKAPGYVHDIENDFYTDWSGKNPHLAVMGVPEAVRRRLLAYAPPGGKIPARLERQGPVPDGGVWTFIWNAHRIQNGGMVGVATAPVEPWPHQIRVFLRLRAASPVRILIADEVGLGKTIQAGLFLRQAWLEGRRRILIMAPAGLTRQWQKELREKLNLDWPVYGGSGLNWQETHAKGGGRKISSDRENGMSVLATSGHGRRADMGTLSGSWTRQGPVIVSTHLARRDAYAAEICNTEWDIVVLDEAHYARQTNPNNPNKHTPNKTLRLMRTLQGKTRDLILMTATPMQLHLVELYDLLALLGLPRGWSWESFEKFDRRLPGLDVADLEFMSDLYRASVEEYGPIDAERLGVSELRAKNALRILAGDLGIRPLPSDFDIIRRVLLSCSPVTRMVSRNTRRQLREHIRSNNLDWKLGERDVNDYAVQMSAEERALYDEVGRYITRIWNSYRGGTRQAVGFVLTIYRKRLASSFAAFEATLERHLAKLGGAAMPHGGQHLYVYEDEYEDMDTAEIEQKEEDALKKLDMEHVRRLLDMKRGLPPDTKIESLVNKITELRKNDYSQVMVFTQFTDTMDFLRDRLKQNWSVMCYSGRGGEEPGPDGWTSLSRDEAKTKFMDGKVDILLCTDAAAEGLNFQSCGAMINYDMPWNPMRVEQRIGRIDRIGQTHATIRIVNMYYADTIEARIYHTLRQRIRLFEDVVGTLQPILAKLEDMIKKCVLDGGEIFQYADLDAEEEHAGHGLDLDGLLAAGTEQLEPPKSPVTMKDLARIAGNSGLMRGFRTHPAGDGQYHIDGPYDRRVLITTDRRLFERHSGSMEFWSPGSPVFPEPGKVSDASKCETLGQLLNEIEQGRA